MCGVSTARGCTLITQDYPGIYPEGFVLFITVSKDILSNMKKEYMTVYAGVNRYKMTRACEANLYAMLLWLTDKQRLGQALDNAAPTINSLNDSVEYDHLCCQCIADAPTAAATHNPGSFSNKSHWITWHAKLVSFLTSQPGDTGISLAYVICKDKIAPPPATYDTFHEKFIAKALLREINQFYFSYQQKLCLLVGFIKLITKRYMN